MADEKIQWDEPKKEENISWEKKKWYEPKQTVGQALTNLVNRPTQDWGEAGVPLSEAINAIGRYS